MPISVVLCILQNDSFIPVSKITSEKVQPTADYPHTQVKCVASNVTKDEYMFCGISSPFVMMFVTVSYVFMFCLLTGYYLVTTCSM